MIKSKAVYFNGNRQLEVRQLEVPEPKDHQVQVKSVINGICMMEVWQFNREEANEPFMAGHEGVGVVTRTGKGVTTLQAGDFVYAPKWNEYQNIDAASAIKLSCTAETADDFILEPASCAVTAAAYLQIYPGDRVIVFGAGYMGLLLLQLLGKSPVSELIAIDVKPANLELAKQFGATETLCFGTAECSRRLAELERDPVDIAVEGSGAAAALDLCTKLVRRGGKIGIYSWHHHPRMIDASAWHTKGLKVLNVAPGITSDDLPKRQFKAAERLIRAGVIRQRQMITHRYSLDDAARAMEESTVRGDQFIKSVFVF